MVHPDHASRIKKAAAIYGWEYPLLTFIYRGVDCGSPNVNPGLIPPTYSDGGVFGFSAGSSLLKGNTPMQWTAEILCHLSPGMTICLQIPTNNGFPGFNSGAGFRPSSISKRGGLANPGQHYTPSDYHGSCLPKQRGAGSFHASLGEGTL